MTDAADLNLPPLVIRQNWQREPADDLAYSVSLARDVADGRIAEARAIRVYRPRPTLALSRRESLRPGFADACRLARELHFDPVVRPTGGRAVAYDESCVVFDLITRTYSAQSSERLFRVVATALSGALTLAGVDARVGAVPGEYCPGPYSVNARGVVKLIGTSQRGLRGARLLSGMVALGPVDTLAAVVGGANDTLGLEWNPATFGTLRDELVWQDDEEVESLLVTALRDT